jgi:hypothetical protein
VPRFADLGGSDRLSHAEATRLQRPSSSSADELRSQFLQRGHEFVRGKKFVPVDLRCTFRRLERQRRVAPISVRRVEELAEAVITMDGVGLVRISRLVSLVGASVIVVLGGCGTYIPQMQEAWETSRTPVLTAGGDLEFKIREKIYCEIVQAVHDNDALLSGAVGGAGHSRPPGR